MKIIDRPSPNFDEREGSGQVDTLILHYTGMETAQAALDRLCDPESKVSAHYMIDEDGTIYAHVPEEKRAWHAGASFWNGQLGINNSSIGIEIVNPGHEFGYRSFPEQQLESVIKLSQEIIKRYGIDRKNVLAHSDIAPSRKADPGELFPWKTLAENGVGIWPDPSDEDAVKAASIITQSALHDLGYDPRCKFKDKLVAFQRHYVPEVFEAGQAGQETSLSKARLYTLLRKIGED